MSRPFGPRPCPTAMGYRALYLDERARRMFAPGAEPARGFTEEHDGPAVMDQHGFGEVLALMAELISFDEASYRAELRANSRLVLR